MPKFVEREEGAVRQIHFDDLARRLRRNVGHLLTPEVMGAIAGVIEEGTLDRMEREVSVQGQPLARLNPEYVLWKVTGSRKPKIARRRMALYQRRLAEGKKAPTFREKGRRVGGYSPKIWQLTGESKRKVRTINITARRATVQINTPYSGHVNDGYRQMPARPVLGISDSDEKAIGEIMIRAARAAFTEG